eukprot:432549_1
MYDNRSELLNIAEHKDMYDNKAKISYFIQITDVSHDAFTIRLDVSTKNKKNKRKYYIKEVSNAEDSELGTITIIRKQQCGYQVIDFETKHDEEYKIAIFEKNDNLINKPLSNVIKFIKCPCNIENNYKPKSIDTSTIIKILDKRHKKVNIYWNTPTLSFGEIQYKIVYTQNDDDSKDVIVELLPYSIPLSSMKTPLEIEIITISIFD